MGGSGSGIGIRWNTSRTKNFVEQYPCIDARSFPYRHMKNISENGIPAYAHGVELKVLKNKLEIHHRADSAHVGYSIPFSLSHGNYGNKRYWFICPNPSCRGRYRKLYLAKAPNGLPLFLCRKCLNLAYKSQNRIKLDRIIDKKWELVRSLGCDSDFFLADEKPKWMQRKTFNKIREKIEYLNEEAMRGIAALCGGMSIAEYVRGQLS